MHKTKIDYATHTWNPVYGCRRGCPYCYAQTYVEQRRKMSFEPQWMEKNFARPMPREPGARIFVNSLSDIEWWEEGWWVRVLSRVRENPQHRFLFLTKNPDAYRKHDPWPYWPINCWLGTTVTTESEVLTRQGMPASGQVRFLSIEPMLERIDPDFVDPTVIDWVILGAETGHRPGRVIPPADWIAPWLQLEIPLFMKDNLPWDGPRRREYPE